MPANKLEGWAKIAFTYAFKYLREGEPYREAICNSTVPSCMIDQTILAAGDTDTNAAIVGGMVGAAIGFSNIPNDVHSVVLGYDTDKAPHKRKDFLVPKRSDLMKMITDIYAKRASKIVLKE